MSKLYMAYGKDPYGLTSALLEEVNPFLHLNKQTVFGIKPNLVSATKASQGATTHPQVVEAIVAVLQEQGFSRIKIMEGAWVGEDTERAFSVCGYRALSKKMGVPLIDLKKDGFVEKTVDGLTIKVCKQVYETDYLINVPLFKGHCQTNITCALKNLKGVIPDEEKRRFHTLGLHKPIAWLNRVVHQNLIIVDGICPDPYFEEGGRPKRMNRVALGFDPCAVDAYAAKLLGYETGDVRYIGLAEKAGVGKTGPIEVVDINKNEMTPEAIVQPSKKYMNMVDEAGACSACYANLTEALHKMEKIYGSEALADNIAIGQGYKEYRGKVGIGTCTKACEKNVLGCPPSSEAIYQFLESIIRL